MAFDHNTFDTLYIGCGNCSSKQGKGHGVIYSYNRVPNDKKIPSSSSLSSLSSSSASSPSTHWSLTQEIYFTSLYNMGMEKLKVHGDLMLADHYDVPYDSPSPRRSSILLRKSKNGQFEHEQVLNVPFSNSVSEFDVYHDTIVLSSKDETVSSLANCGAVYILGPTLLPPEAPGKPRAVQWSIQQVLHADSLIVNLHFGDGISIDGDRLSILNNHFSHFNYVYERDKTLGKWSLQQKFFTPNTQHQVVLRGAKMAVLTHNIFLYDLYGQSDCLVLSLEDQFGDDWDTARLVITAPNGEKDYLQTRCDLTNPYQVRFCPRKYEDIGLYHFEIINGASKAKNFWEILWRVYNENTGEWIIGNWDTKLDFEWDSINGRFNGRKVIKPLPANTTCSPCPIKPTGKPTPLIRKNRHLKDNDNINNNNGGTVHPTHTPAPTLATSFGFNWRSLTLVETAVGQWFQNDHRGANYYVTDAKSRKLVTTGTLCDWELTGKQCWLDLPDGTYKIRVGGALLKDSTTLSWFYCNNLHPLKAKTELIVKIYDESCTILGAHTRDAFCTGMDPAIEILIEFLIVSTTSTTLSNDITTNEKNAIIDALSFTFQGVSTDNVNILSITPNSDGYFVSTILTFRRSTTGYDVLDAEVVENLLNMVQNYMLNDGPRTISAGLQASTMNNLFRTTSSIIFVSAEISGSSDIPLIKTQVEKVTSYLSENNSSISSTTELINHNYSTLESISIIGYVVTGLFTIIGAIFLVVGYRFRTLLINNKNDNNNNNNNNDNEQMIETLSPQSSLNTKNQNKSTNKKRVQLKDNVLSVEDLRELIQDVRNLFKLFILIIYLFAIYYLLFVDLLFYRKMKLLN